MAVTPSRLPWCVIDRTNANNPISTVAIGLAHFEYRTYPEVAVREALLNAFVHADYQIAGAPHGQAIQRKARNQQPGWFHRRHLL